MKSIVLILIIVAAVYAVDDDSEQKIGADLAHLDQLLKEIVGKLEDQKEGDVIDPKRAISEFAAFDDVVARRPKRSWAERKEKKRLIEIDALVEKLWADKDKKVNGETTDIPVTEQEQSDTEHEVKAPRRNGAHPRFESSADHPHDRKESRRSKKERKQAKVDEPKTAKHAEGEEDSGEHSIHAENGEDTEKVPDVAKEVKNRKFEKPKKTFTKNQRKEKSDEDRSTESVNENVDVDSGTSDLQDSSSAIPRKVTGSVESDLVGSELATDAPQESFVSEPASSALPAPVVPATATSADTKRIASDDASSVDYVHSDPIATASPVLAVSEDSVLAASEDSIPDVPADPVLAAAANPVSFISANIDPATSADSDPIAAADSTSATSTGSPDDVADEEETSAKPVKSLNLDQARPKRQVSPVTESPKGGKTPKQVKQKPTGLLDRLVTAANSTVSRKEKSNIEPKNKAPAKEDRTDQKNGSTTRKGYPDEKKGEEKKMKSEKKDQQTNIKADKDISEKAQSNATNVRTNARSPVKQQGSVPLTSDVGKTGSGDMNQARILQTKYKSRSVATTGPKNGKTSAKKPSASATHDVPNEEKTPTTNEADIAV